MDYAKLKDVYDAAPPEAVTDDAAFVAWGYTPSIARLKSLTSAELLVFAAQEGRYARLAAGAQSDNPVIKSLAMVAETMLNRDGTVLDLNLADRAALVDGLVATGLFTADDKTALYALATEIVSPFDAAGLPPVGEHHVAHVRSLNQ